MKRFGAAFLATVGLLAGSASAQACCWWPFGGWGAGYGYSAPSYGNYAAMYAPAFPMYSVSYAPAMGGACCAPVCCDPCACGSNCAPGACTGKSDTGTLKPQIDENFNERSDTYDKAPAAKPTPAATPETTPRTQPPADETFSAPPTRRPATTPSDDFRTPPVEPAPFGADNEISNKPPLPDLTEPATPAPANQPADSGDSFQPEPAPAPAPGATETAPQASRPGRTVLAERSSQISEVLRSPRLATKSPAASANSRTSTLSGSANRVRWISAPLTEGHERL